MPSILLPSPDRLRKPPVSARLNRAHSLAVGLIRIWTFAEGGGLRVFDAQQGSAGSITGGTWKVGASGYAVQHGSTSDVVNLGASPDFLPTIAGTFVLGYRKSDTTNRVSAAIGVNQNGVDTTTRIGAHLPYSDGTVYFDWGGTAEGSSRLSVGGLTFGNDLWVFSSGSRGMEIWQNGTLRASNAGTTTRANDPVCSWLLGAGAQDTPTGDLAEYSYLSIYGRQLAPGEIAALTADRYQMFSPPVWRRHIASAAPPATTAPPPWPPAYRLQPLLGR